MRNLGQLRTAVLAALGFIDPFTNPSLATMGTLRTRIRSQLGLADPITAIQTRTMGALRTSMYYELGWAAQALFPPSGMPEMLGDIINEAQRVLWRRLELDKGATAMPAEMATGDLCSVDSPLLFAMACAMAAKHYNKPEAQDFKERAERQLADYLQRSPPGIDALITTQLIEAQETSYRRYAQRGGATFSLNAFAVDGDSTTIDHTPVYLLALANLKARLKQDDAKAYFQQWENYYAELERRMPANASSVVTQHLKSANDTLFRRYRVLIIERFFTWTTVAAQNMYELDENDEQNPGPSQCLAVIDPRSITWAGIEREGVWYPLIRGIPPEMYSNNFLSNIPSRYEIRQCIEIWPSPGTGLQKIRMKGHARPESFTLDADEPAVDDQALFLLAVATCKPLFKQPDAQIFTAQLEAYIANCVAGLHQTARYMPGNDVRAGYVQPAPTVPFP